MLLFFLCVFIALCRGCGSNYSGHKGTQGTQGVDYTPPSLEEENYAGMHAHNIAHMELERMRLWMDTDLFLDKPLSDTWCYTLNPQLYPDTVYETAASICASWRECTFKDRHAEYRAQRASDAVRRQKCLAEASSESEAYYCGGGAVGYVEIHNEFCMKRRKPIN